MLRLLINILLYFLYANLVFRVQSKIFDKKIDYKNILTIGLIMLFVAYGLINVLFINNFLRFINITIGLSIISSIMFKEKIIDSFLISILQQFIFFIIELFFYSSLRIFNFDVYNLTLNNLLFNFILNILIYACSYYILSLNFIKTIYNKISVRISKINWLDFIIISIFFILSLNFLLFYIYSNEENFIVFFVNLIFMIIYSLILFFFIYEKNLNIKNEEKNKALIANLNEYERMLNYQTIKNHENKNQLLILNSLIKSKDDNVEKYFDELLKEKLSDDENVYNKVRFIPSGGLRGIIYQKMLLMQELNITVNLCISRNLNAGNFSAISAKTNFDLCTALGIILDNAIEETKKLKQKEILISIYFIDQFVIEISNYYETINMDKISLQGYTTKGVGHGFGLSLLRKIVNNNKDILNETFIINNIFTQQLKIKI